MNDQPSSSKFCSPLSSALLRAVNRAPGLYWVRLKPGAEWQKIARWSESQWHVLGGEAPPEDSDLVQIRPRLRPA